MLACRRQDRVRRRTPPELDGRRHGTAVRRRPDLLHRYRRPVPAPVGHAEGRALHSHGVANISETLAPNPDRTGRTASSARHFSPRVTYDVPGDQSTRVEVFSGNDVTVVVPGTGLVIHDVGVKSFDIDGNALFAHGQHDVLEDADAAFAKVCDALQG